MENELLNQSKVKAWKNFLLANGCTISSISPIAQIKKRDDSLLFALLSADVTSPEGNKLPHIVFIRGHAVVIVPLLRNKDTGEEKYLMVRQRRIGNGQMSLEFPAGMLDESSNPLEVAVRELNEETGLSIDRSNLKPLTDTMLYSSAGAIDEAIYYYGCIIELNETDFQSYIGRKGGCEHEHEFISTVLMTREEAEREATSLQVHLGFFLFDQQIKRNLQ